MATPGKDRALLGYMRASRLPSPFDLGWGRASGLCDDEPACALTETGTSVSAS